MNEEIRTYMITLFYKGLSELSLKPEEVDPILSDLYRYILPRKRCLKSMIKGLTEKSVNHSYNRGILTRCWRYQMSEAEGKPLKVTKARRKTYKVLLAMFPNYCVIRLEDEWDVTDERVRLGLEEMADGSIREFHKFIILEKENE